MHHKTWDEQIWQLGFGKISIHDSSPHKIYLYNEKKCDF
jgi:lysophospholipid acyltransferase (LPLAT)-like uncharacterized protein